MAASLIHERVELLTHSDADSENLVSEEVHEADCQQQKNFRRKSFAAFLLLGLVLLVIGLAVWSRSETQSVRESKHFVTALVSKAEEQVDEKAKKMVAQYQSYIDELGVEVLQCKEGIAKLESLKSQNPYVMNAMIPSLGQKGRDCSLADYDVHENPPAEGKHEEVCAVHCGECECPVSLDYIKEHREVLKKRCGRLLYLQGGALCFLHEGVGQNNRTACGYLIEGKNLFQYQSLAKEMNIKDIHCGEKGWMEQVIGLDAYVFNVMVGVFGKRGNSCSPKSKSFSSVHGSAPSSPQSNCLIYCGESFCPYAHKFIHGQKYALSRNCKNLYLLRGGAKCLLKHGMPLEDKHKCAKIVLGSTDALAALEGKLP